MKANLKKKLAEMLLDLLIRQGLKIDPNYFEMRPVLVEDFQKTQDLLERLGYEFTIRRRLQANPKDTPKKIHLKMMRKRSDWRMLDEAERTMETRIWICLDADVALKALVLGGFPEKIIP